MSVWEPNDLIENKPVWSANGRFCVIVRWHPSVPDFTSERAGKVLHLDDPEPLTSAIEQNTETRVEPDRTVAAALYESVGGSRVLVTELAMEREDDQVLVSDSGRYVVAFHNLGNRVGCIRSGATIDDRLLTLYTVAASRIGRFNVGDVLNPYDVLQLNRRSDEPVRIELRHETVEREIVALEFPAPGDGRQQPRTEERRIDLTTNSLLDPKRDIYPVPHAFATPSVPGVHREVTKAACKSGTSAPVRIASEELLARTVRGPLPEFPIIALKANIRGRVSVEFLVSERGEVVCTRSSYLPFGIAEAAEAAARRWRFKPYVVDGQPKAVISELVFHFEDIDAATWARTARTFPPAE